MLELRQFFSFSTNYQVIQFALKIKIRKLSKWSNLSKSSMSSYRLQRWSFFSCDAMAMFYFLQRCDSDYFWTFPTIAIVAIIFPNHRDRLFCDVCITLRFWGVLEGFWRFWGGFEKFWVGFSVLTHLLRPRCKGNSLNNVILNSKFYRLSYD